MKGETTLDQRIMERLKDLDRLHQFYLQQFPRISQEDLVAQLIADATYLAIYYGVDLETTFKEVSEDITKFYPDVP